MSAADPAGPIGAGATWLRSGPQKYGFAIAMEATATGLRFALEIALGPFPPFVMFVPAIILAAVLGGFGPGILATILSSTSVALFFWDSLKSFGPMAAREEVGLVLFSIVGAGLSGLAALYRRHATRLVEFQRVVEGLDEMIAVVDRDYRYLIANRAFLQCRGVKSQDVVGHGVAEVLSPAVFEEKIRPNLGKCFQGQVVQYEMQYEYPKRGKRDLLVSYLPIAGANGIDRAACILQDITQVKDAERSLRLFRTLIDQSNDAVEVLDPETLRVLDVNETACKHLGYSREELLAMTVYDFDPRLTEEERTRVVESLREGKCVLGETIHRRKDGSIFPVETSLTIVKLEKEYLIAVSRDISGRKKAEDALKENEGRYRDLVEHSEDLVCTHDLAGKLISVNRSAARCLGYGVEELLRIPMRELIAPEFRRDFDAYLQRIKTKCADEGLMCVVTRSGERVIWEYRNTLRTEGVPEPIVRGMAHDVTERMRAEAALRSSEERYRTLFEKSVAGVAISNVKGEILDCNEAWARILGYDSPADIRGRHASEFYFDLSERESARSELLQNGSLSSREIQLRRKDGTPVWILYSSTVRPENRGGPAVLQATVIDITARRQAEDALRQREEEYRQFVAQSSEGIFREDLDAPLPLEMPEDELIHHILYDSYLAECNDAMARMYGFQSSREFVGKRLTELLVADDPRNIELTRQYIRSGFRLLERESHEVDAKGSPKVFRNSMIGIVENGKLVRTWGIQRDVTEQVKLEDQIRRSEQRFRMALKDSPITVFCQDKELRFTWVYNSQLMKPEQIIGKTDEEVMGLQNIKRLVELKRRVLSTGKALREEVLILHNGKNYSYDINLEPIFDAEQNVTGIRGSAVDIARLREQADRLQDARDRLVQEKSYLESEIHSELGFEEIIGQSSSLREVLSKARVVAPTDSTVLLLGETGTGKELAARSIHALSSRRDKTFVKLNCAAVPSGLLESELFGHEKGAFTGAVSQKVGRIELADKGTLFLDEIGELPPELQPKLLRVLQDREFERLGAVHTLHVDVRIIAATNRDLARDVSEKKFREDLFYRLNVFPIELPPLRERRGDIPMLVQHFMLKHAGRIGKHIDTIPEETMEILLRWGWPGNIRELENMIERMVILTKGHVLAPPPAELEQTMDGVEDSLSAMEREHIVRVLRDSNGVLSGMDGAASRLGIKRTTLQSMLKRFGIEAREFRRTGTFGRD